MSHESLGKMSANELRKKVNRFLNSQNMCVLATCSGTEPRATPIEYHVDGLNLYFIGEQGAKLRNIRLNNHVSVGVFKPYTGWESTCGAQITGVARIIPRGDSAEFNQGLVIIKWENTAQEMGLKVFPKNVELVRVDPSKIEYIDLSLKKDGYSPRQLLDLE